jgi:hypothetical protein
VSDEVAVGPRGGDRFAQHRRPAQHRARVYTSVPAVGMWEDRQTS